MKARDLFDAFGRLPESYRLEALDSPEQDASGEINALFAETIRRQSEPDTKEIKTTESRRIAVRDVQPPIRKNTQNPIRNLTIGLTAVAAVIAVTVGVMVWRVHQETIDDAGVTEQVGPAVQTDQFADPEGQHDQQDQKTSVTFLHPGKDEGKGVRHQQTEKRGFCSQYNGFPDDLAIGRLEQGYVIFKGKLVGDAAI